MIPQQPVVEELDSPPTMEEVFQAITQMKCQRAAGRDGIPAELLIHGGDKVAAELLTLFSEIWSSEQIPKEWVDAVIVPIPKKGDVRHCGNWRGISLLSVPGKVLLALLPIT